MTETMSIQKRVLSFITRANWVLLCVAGMVGVVVSPLDFAGGIIAGGLIVTINFHLLSRTLKRSLTPPYLSSHHAVLAKYYIRFTITGIILFVLISGHFVDPLGLVIGLSVVVASIFLATLCELKKLIISKEAV